MNFETSITILNINTHFDELMPERYEDQFKFWRKAAGYDYADSRFMMQNRDMTPACRIKMLEASRNSEHSFGSF